MQCNELGNKLLLWARRAIEQAIKLSHDGQAGGDEMPHDTLVSSKPEPFGACFVTLTQDGELRGCIGTLEPWRSLREDVEANAVAAALRDPRFAPLQADECANTRVEVSVLSELEPMTFADESDALAQLRPGIDGLVLSCGRHRAAFLPQVWEQLPDPGVFMSQLKRKAGLPTHFWSPDVRLQRFTVSKWKEPA